MSQKFTTVAAALTWAENAFADAHLYYGHGTDNAWDDAVAILVFVLSLPVDVSDDVLPRVLTAEESEQLDNLFQQRISQRIPSAYLTQQAWFCGLPFYVDERVIIPRSPISELIINQFSPWIEEQNVHRILDLCCGSACIAIACAYAFPEATIDAVELSEQALVVADINVQQHEVQHQVQLIQSDLFANVANQQYDIIVSNPPYVDAEDIASMPNEYHHEPAMALASGCDGLDITRRILLHAAEFLTEQGILIVEVGNSAETLECLYPNLPLIWLEFEQGGQGVFMLTKSQLLTWREGIKKTCS